jgi:tagatose 1,6-diphosphate aldolase
MEVSAGKLWAMRRLADAEGLFRMVALDQRPPIMSLIKEKTGAATTPDEQIVAVKRVIAETLAEHASAVLVDPIWAYPAVIGTCVPHRGLILTLEDHRFEETPRGRKTHAIEGWSVAKIKRLGGDGVKVLAYYRPDAPREVTEHQKRFVRAVGDACRRFDIPFVFELLVYPLKQPAGGNDYLEDPQKRPELVIESVQTFAAEEYGVDIFKLESPIPAESVPDPKEADEAEIARVQGLFDQLGKAAGRPWVMLSAGAGQAAFRRVLHYAFKAGASGFLAGRAIWLDAAQAYPDLDAMRTGMREGSAAYLKEITALARAQATPWSKHPCFSGQAPILRHAGLGFPKAYESL